NEFWDQLNQTLPHRQRLFFLTRVPIADPTIRRYLQQAIPLKLIESYRYRTYDYLLYEIDRATIYTPEMQDFIRRRSENLSEDSVITIPHDQLFKLPYQKIFPIENLTDWRIEVNANYGIRYPECWSFQPKKIDIGQTRQLTFRLLNKKGFELMRRQLHLTVNNSASSVTVKPFYLGNPEPLANFPSNAESSPVIFERPRRQVLPMPLRIMFFSSPYTHFSPNALLERLAIEVVNPDDNTKAEKIWYYSKTYQKLLNGRTPRRPKSYWDDSELLLPKDKEIDMVFMVLCSGELLSVTEAESHFGKRLDDLLTNLSELVNEIRLHRPNVLLVLGTESTGEPVTFPADLPQLYYPLHRTAEQFNRELIRQFGGRETDGIFVADLTTGLNVPEAYIRTTKTIKAVKLTPAGEKILTENICRFLKDIGVQEKTNHAKPE
ncbi:MAG: hypothetical protein LBM70_01750, partial [Victivallales bacterium]|nr:hypothetical protein [Victivallales bacterium]